MFCSKCGANVADGAAFCARADSLCPESGVVPAATSVNAMGVQFGACRRLSTRVSGCASLR